MVSNSSENHVVYETMWGKYDSTRESTDENIIRRMHFERWLTKATDTLGRFNTYCFFHGNDGYGNAPHCCAMHNCLSYSLSVTLF